MGAIKELKGWASYKSKGIGGRLKIQAHQQDSA